jgi:rhamnulokinase
MSRAIEDYCRAAGMPIPRGRGEAVRCVLESLAAKYCTEIEKMERVASRRIERLFVVGGGSRNRLLNQFIADATGLQVVTGLAEGTAVGNIMQQAIADGAVSGWEEAHAIIRASFEWESFYPVGI